MKLIVVAAAALIRDGRVLLAQRPEGKPLAGLWEFPGGKLEFLGGKLDDAETPESCLVRELKEELSITVDEAALAPITFASHGLSADKHLLMPLYSVRDWEGEPVGAEGQDLQWVEASEIETFELPDADYPLIPFVKSAMADLN